MLLTSAQVSVAISSTIVSIFTISLFLSGYVLQQRTVNNIREAIRPKLRPIHTFVPDAVPTVQATVHATATPTALAGDGSMVIEIPGTNGDSDLRTAGQQDYTREDSGEEANLKQEQEDQLQTEPTAPSEQEVVSDTKLVASSRIRRPSQVENDKKDKEWAAQLKEFNNRKAAKEDIPLEHLSRAERRKIFKQQLSVQEGQQPVDPRAYRPRRRLW